MEQGEVSESHLRSLKREFGHDFGEEDFNSAIKNAQQHVEVTDMKEISHEDQIQTETMSPPLVTSNKSTPKIPTGQHLKAEASPVGVRALADEPMPKVPQQQDSNEENDSFHRLYNKEIKVN